MSPEDALLRTPSDKDVPQDPFDAAKIVADAQEVGVENVVLKNALEPGEFGIFDKVFGIAKLSKEDYRLIEDSVKFSTWNQSANTNGRRDIITLYAYQAKFRRVSDLDRRTEELVQELAESARARRKGSNRRIPGSGLEAPSTYTALFSDWQLGKNEIRSQDLKHGKTGVEQTTWRIERGLDLSIQRIKKLRKAGRNIEAIAPGFMGDATENVSDSYPNQPFIVELNLVDQIERALDLMVLVCEELLPLSDSDPSIFGVLCNHGQLTRKNTKTNITDDADNVQNLLMRLLRDRIIGPAFPGAKWYVPEQEMITTFALSGVPIAAAHGHKIPSGISGEFKWLSAQSNNLAEKRGTKPKVWLTAHRHSHDYKDFGAIHRLQAATADGGSKHFEDSTAIYSTPGTSVVLIGNHDERGFSDFELL